MNDNSQLDQILKQGLENLEVPAPDGAWEAIRSGIQAAPVPQPPSGGNTLLQAFQQIGVGTKIALVAAIPLVASVVYMAVQEKEAPRDIHTTSSSITSIPVPENKVEEVSKIAEFKGVQAPQKATQVLKQQVKEKPTFEISQPVSPDIVAPEKPVISNPTNDNSTQQPAPPPTPADPLKEKQNVTPLTVPNTKHEEPNETNPAKPEFGFAFSPNGDGINDTWVIRIEPTTYYHLRVIDKRGQVVYETDQATQFWTGIHQRNGQECESGQYTFIIDYQFKTTDKIKTQTGFINLIR